MGQNNEAQKTQLNINQFFFIAFSQQFFLNFISMLEIGKETPSMEGTSGFFCFLRSTSANCSSKNRFTPTSAASWCEVLDTTKWKNA